MGTNTALFKRAALAAATGAAQPALSQPSLAVPDEVLKAIGGILNECMERAVQNGANSVSMPDEYVHVAAWLCGIPKQDASPQPTEPAQPSTQAGVDGRYRFLLGFLIERGVLTDKRYNNGTWSLQGIYGVDDSGLRGAGRTPEEAIDNAMVAVNLNSVEAQRFWSQTHAALAPTPQPLAAEQGEDAARLDWLETMVVNVRQPLRYGSRDLFWASPEDMDGGPDGPSGIRKQIDAARAAQGQNGQRKHTP